MHAARTCSEPSISWDCPRGFHKAL